MDGIDHELDRRVELSNSLEVFAREPWVLEDTSRWIVSG
jgi:hypothetical protein